MVKRGAVWCSMVQCGVVWCIMVQYGVVWCSMVQYGAVWCSMVLYGAVWCIMVQYGAVWCSMVQYGVELCRMVQYNPVWCSAVQCGGVRGHYSRERLTQLSALGAIWWQQSWKMTQKWNGTSALNLEKLLFGLVLKLAQHTQRRQGLLYKKRCNSLTQQNVFLLIKSLKR